MNMICPLSEDNIARFCGMPVCAVTHDGRRHFGILSACRNGTVVFNEFAGLHGADAPAHETDITTIQNKAKKTKAGKTKKTKAGSSEKAQTQAFYPYGYGPFSPFGATFALDLALIAFLFLLFI